MDDHSPCGFSITGNINIYQWSKGNDVTTSDGEVPYGLLSRSCFYCSNLITVAPVTRDKEICQSHANMK